jgi:uncharacterized damage-inducible protein DinB
VTATLAIARPGADEYFEYYGKYVALLATDDAMTALQDQIADTVRVLKSADETRALHRYAPGKWSVKEVVGHVTDAERIFAYRALRIGRADTTPIEGFDENTYVPAGRFDRRPLTELVTDYEIARQGTLALFRGFDEEAMTRRGTANGKTISVRAIAWIIAGHELHHRSILVEKYGLGR